MTTINKLVSGDLFHLPDSTGDKFLFLHFDEKHYFYLNLSIKGSVPDRTYKNLSLIEVGNVKQFIK